MDNKIKDLFNVSSSDDIKIVLIKIYQELVLIKYELKYLNEIQNNNARKP